MKMAFLDRDGTILKDYSLEDWPNVTEPEFLPGAIDCLKELMARDFMLSVLMYEYMIGEGIITEAQHNAYTQKMIAELSKNGIMLDAIELCPHARNIPCRCAKPKTGMIDDILDRFPDLDLDASFLAGDSMLDVQMAQNKELKLKTFSIGFTAPNATRVESLSEVLVHI
jgi:D-glycero-D-manno-heptose 1,7-bisphosphate phosphatase